MADRSLETLTEQIVVNTLLDDAIRGFICAVTETAGGRNVVVEKLAPPARDQLLVEVRWD